MAALIYLETGSSDPAYNLAFEEYVLTHRRVGNYLILWQNRNAVIIGRNQNAAEEINQSFVQAHGIQVVRRNTGGGAVYHDMGNLNYSFITDAGDPENRSASLFTTPVVEALQNLGLDATASGRNDILVSSRKISGTAQQILKGRILHHGTLLFDSNPDMISGALNPDPTKFQSKSVKSVRSRVGNIRPFLPRDMDMEGFWTYLKTALSKNGVTPDALSKEELAQVQALKTAKYDTWEWNFGKSPKSQMCCKRRWPAGLLEIHLSIDNGVISEIQILGDFLAVTSLEPLREALTGCQYKEESIRKILDNFSLQEYLGGITGEEFLKTLLIND